MPYTLYRLVIIISILIYMATAIRKEGLEEGGEAWREDLTGSKLHPPTHLPEQGIESSAKHRDPSAFGTSPSQGEEGLLTNNGKAKIFLATKPLKALSPLRRGIIGGLTLSAITDFCVHGSPFGEKGLGDEELALLAEWAKITHK
jgi:hypothetical protein